MKEQWWSDRATELQEAADRKNAKLFYDGLKAIYGPQANGSSSILSADAERNTTHTTQLHTGTVGRTLQRCDKPVIHNLTGRDRQHSTATAHGRTSAAAGSAQHLMKLLQQSRNFPVEKQQDQMRLLPKFTSTVE